LEEKNRKISKQQDSFKKHHVCAMVIPDKKERNKRENLEE
jgi:hypothetical protein